MGFVYRLLYPLAQDLSFSSRPISATKLQKTTQRARTNLQFVFRVLSSPDERKQPLSILKTAQPFAQQNDVSFSLNGSLRSKRRLP